MREIRMMKSEGEEGKGRGIGYSSRVDKSTDEELKYRYHATKINDILAPACWNAKTHYCKHSIRMI